MKSRDPGFEPWDGEAWIRSKGEGVSKCLAHQKGRGRKSSRAEISETKRGQEVKRWSRIQGRLSLWVLGKEL